MAVTRLGPGLEGSEVPDDVGLRRREALVARVVSRVVANCGPCRLGSYQLRHDIPTELIGRMIRHRIGEYENEGVKWM